MAMVHKENLVILKSSNISETGEATPSKLGVHVPETNLYLHEFFEPILFFDLQREIWNFLKIAIIFEREVTPTKIDLHALHVNLNLHEFFELILFIDPMENLATLKASKNLQNQRNHAHQK